MTLAALGFQKAESEPELRAMTEANGHGARRRVAGKGIETAPQKVAPEKVTSTTHVNVALPFAKVEVHEPSEYLLALATLVQDMAGLLARTAPGHETDAVDRANELAARLR
jgi:hypothetical protein